MNNTSEIFAPAIQYMGSVYPSLITFYSICDKRENPDCTLRLNTRTGMTPVLEYDPEFIRIISTRTLSVLISVEMFRLLLHHTTTRLLHPVELCWHSSNIICTQKDMISIKIDESVRKQFPSIDDVTKIEPRFNYNEDGNLETIFSIFKSQQTVEPDAIEAFKYMAEGKPDTKYESEEDAIRKHFSRKNAIKNTAGWGENNLIDERVQREVSKEQSNTKNWNRFPTNLKIKILEANRRKYDVMAILRHLVTSVISTKIYKRRTRPNRRFPAWTGIIPGNGYQKHAKVLFATDTSASMRNEEIGKAANFVESAFKQAKVYYCWWDASCSDIVELKKPCPKDPVGGGGTNPQCVIDRVNKEGLRFDCIVFITDCGFTWSRPNIAHSTKLALLQTSDAVNPPPWFPWVLKMDDLLKQAG